MTKENAVADSPKQKIADRISAGQERNRARGTVREVIEEHPIAVIAGGILLGAVLAQFLPKTGLARYGRRAAALAAAGGELAMLYGSKAADSAGDVAREGREKLGELGDTVSDTAAEAKRKGLDLADVALAGVKAFGGSTARRVSDLASKVRH